MGAVSVPSAAAQVSITVVGARVVSGEVAHARIPVDAEVKMGRDQSPLVIAAIAMADSQ